MSNSDGMVRRSFLGGWRFVMRGPFWVRNSFGDYFGVKDFGGLFLVRSNNSP